MTMNCPLFSLDLSFQVVDAFQCDLDGTEKIRERHGVADATGAGQGLEVVLIIFDHKVDDHVEDLGRKLLNGHREKQNWVLGTERLRKRVEGLYGGESKERRRWEGEN